MKKQYRSPQLKAAHTLAKDLASVRMLPKKTMRDLDELCLTPVNPLTPRQIARIRAREEVSQAVFARHLGVSLSTIRRWSNMGYLMGYRTPGGQRRFSVQQLDDFLASLEQGSVARD